nr:hypothetical protein [Candidatus Sigynarchaeota archaeon]
MTTLASISPSLPRRTLIKAIEDLPHIIVKQNSTTVTSLDNLYAVFCDLLNELLGLSANRSTIKAFIQQAFIKDSPWLFLIAIGFLASDAVLPAVRRALPPLEAKYNITEYLLNELFTNTHYMSKVVPVDVFQVNQDRKEELARKLLKIFGIGIDGETKEESASILENLDSVEISKLSSELEVIIRKQIQDKLAAEAAAAKPSRE